MDMIERVARKLCKIDYPDQPQDWHDRAWSEFADNARAVIAEMREPTEVMLGAISGTDEQDDEARHVWRHMIDAALATPNPAKHPAIVHDSGTEYDWQVMLDPAVAGSAKV